MSKNYQGKEIGKDEVWVGNTPIDKPLRFIKECKTLRKGHQAYCVHGTKLNPNHYVPIFIHKSEFSIWDKLMTDMSKKSRYG